MKMLVIENLNCSKNHGINAEQSLAYALCGTEPHKHDNVRFDKGSDIEQLHISVKASHSTLVSGGILSADNFVDMVNEYFERVASTAFAYVANDFTTYIMNATEFRAFIETFGALECDSQKNGGKMKIRLRAETKIMRNWLSVRVA